MDYIREVFKEKRYLPVMIAASAAAETVLFYVYGYHWMKSVRYILLTFFLILLGFIDSKKTIIQNKILVAMFAFRGIILMGEITVVSSWRTEMVKSAFGGMAIGFIIFLMAWFLSRRSIGLGDVKLAAVIGWYLGGALIWFDLLFCLTLASVFSLVQIFRKKLTMKDSIPLAPFFSVGTILILLLGF